MRYFFLREWAKMWVHIIHSKIRYFMFFEGSLLFMLFAAFWADALVTKTHHDIVRISLEVAPKSL